MNLANINTCFKILCSYIEKIAIIIVGLFLLLYLIISFIKKLTKNTTKAEDIEKVEDFLIDKGKKVCELAHPISTVKYILEKFEEKKQKIFLQEVLYGLKNVDIKTLNRHKSLQRLYKSVQVIAKAMTQDKLNRFKNLTINGIINQNSLSDDNYDLFVRLTDTLVDMEYIYLYTFAKHIPIEISRDNTESTRAALNDRKKKAERELQEQYGISDSNLNFIRNSLAGYGLVNLAAAFSGLAFNGLSDIAYKYIDFVQGNQQNSNELGA